MPALVSWQAVPGKGNYSQKSTLGDRLQFRTWACSGIKEFTAVINPPQACILAVGGGRSSPKATDDGSLEKKTDMTVNLSSDRRVVNETISAQYLAAFQRYIETPVLLANV